MWTAIPGSLGLTVLGLVVLTSVRILYGTGEGSEGDPVRVAMNVAGAVLLVLGLLGGCMVAMPFWSMQLSIAMFIVVSMSVSRYRTTQKRTLLSIMVCIAWLIWAFLSGVPAPGSVTVVAWACGPVRVGSVTGAPPASTKPGKPVGVTVGVVVGC